MTFFPLQRRRLAAALLLMLLLGAGTATAQISIITADPAGAAPPATATPDGTAAAMTPTTTPTTPPTTPAATAPNADTSAAGPQPARGTVYMTGPNLADPRMHECRTTEDCAVVNRGCGARRMAINSAFAAELQNYYNSGGFKGDCRIVSGDQDDVAFCNPAHQCTLAPPGSNGMPRPDAPQFCNTVADCTIITDACGRKTTMNLQSAAGAPPPGDPANCSYVDTTTVKSLDCANHACRLQLQNQ